MINNTTETSPFIFKASDQIEDGKGLYSGLKTDKFTGHAYLDTYERYVAPLKAKAKNVLEIGINSGHSILMWHDFFSQAKIYGVDINDAPSFLNKERITCYKQDAYSMKFITDEFINKGIKFDLIIDDGPHTMESWRFFAKNYIPLLNTDGVAIIEDIPHISQAYNAMSAVFPEFKGKIYLGNFWSKNNAYDDCVVIFLNQEKKYLDHHYDTNKDTQ